MKTKVLLPTKENLNLAANLIKKGRLVVFPTETVYGIGANALDKKAIDKIFVAKGRPQDNPLIVHICNKKDLFLYAKDVPKIAHALISKFWPGPLTLIVKKSNQIPNNVTANLNTVAIRMPKNKIALNLIKQSGVPIAAPSANSFGKPSPTKAAHAFSDLEGKVEVVLDGKNCQIGIESTVLDITSKIPMILRPGKITKKDIEACIGKVLVHPSISNVNKKTKTTKSPGLKYKHYSPNAKVFLFKTKQDIRKILNQDKGKHKNIAIIDFTKNKTKDKDFLFIDIGNSVDSFCKKLFDAFRICDQKSIDIVFVKAIKKEGLGQAIMNRVERAAKK